MAYKEDRLQKAVATYLDALGVLWCHVANERKTSPISGRRLKEKGVKPGVPDVLVFEPRGDHPGLALELKAPGGRLTPSQRDWLLNLEACGWKAQVATGIDQALEAINQYLGYSQ